MPSSSGHGRPGPEKVLACLRVLERVCFKANIDIAIVLGSGLGDVANIIDGDSVGFDALPGFPATGVSGHAGRLKIGTCGGSRVAVMSGRVHFYESGTADVMRFPLEVLHGLGAETLILTNAAGSLNREFPPGSLMMIEDHINLSGINPLTGIGDDRRFVTMTTAYDPQLRSMLGEAAANAGVSLGSGVYAWVPGPSFETPAEIRALGILGADAVGMSTVPEVILARYLGIRVASVSIITNLAAGLGDEDITHELTKDVAPIGAAALSDVLREFCYGFRTTR